MIKKFLIVIIIAIFYSLGLYIGSTNTLKSIQPRVLRTNTLFTLIQGFRVNNGLQPYIEYQKLCDIADIRLKEIQVRFSHDGFSADRFCTNCFIGENLARNYVDEQVVLDAWLASPKHAENLKRDFIFTCVRTGNGFAVQIFGNFFKQ